MNVYKKARLTAAQENPELSSVEKAHHKLYISREKLLMIEQDDPTKRQTIPNPDEVIQMAKVYKAPELCNHYCTHHCPIGDDNKPLIHDSLSEISAGLMSALYFLENASKSIHEILADSKITQEEKQKFAESLKILRSISYSADCLELWAQKNGLTE